MSSEASISVRGVSKCYAIYGAPGNRLKQAVWPRLQAAFGRPRSTYYREFWALRDVDFDIARGEVVGIVGRNGAGKSTLLQIVCGTLSPSAGTVNLRGRVAALLELGSGFNPDFSGVENVFLNAALLGFSREEAERKLDAILAFADIGEFAGQPVKTYSSGMTMRLAFAVQAQLDPHVLIVDEALAVGDARFQAKCFARLKALRDAGATILFVTHSTEQIVTHCSRALLIEGGRLLEDGQPKAVVNRYLDLLFGRPALGQGESAAEASTPEEPVVSPPCLDWLAGADELFLDPTAAAYESRPTYNKHEYRWGDRRAALLDFMLLDQQEVAGPVRAGARLRILIKFRFASEAFLPILGVTIKTREGVTVFGTNTEMLGVTAMAQLGRPAGVHFAIAEFTAALASGDYFISIGLASRDGESIVPHDRRYDSIHFVVELDSHFFGLADLGMSLSLASTATVE